MSRDSSSHFPRTAVLAGNFFFGGVRGPAKIEGAYMVFAVHTVFAISYVWFVHMCIYLHVGIKSKNYFDGLYQERRIVRQI